MVPVSLEKTCGMQDEQEVYFLKRFTYISKARENIYSFRFPKGNTKEKREFSFPFGTRENLNFLKFVFTLALPVLERKK